MWETESNSAEMALTGLSYTQVKVVLSVAHTRTHATALSGRSAPRLPSTVLVPEEDCTGWPALDQLVSGFGPETNRAFVHKRNAYSSLAYNQQAGGSSPSAPTV